MGSEMRNQSVVSRELATRYTSGSCTIFCARKQTYGNVRRHATPRKIVERMEEVFCKRTYSVVISGGGGTGLRASPSPWQPSRTVQSVEGVDTD